MIRDCRSFERRIQQLMDGRIDPETDEALWRHGSECADCFQTLMACSLMHSEFKNDSDSMKIKLETIGLHELGLRQRKQPQLRQMIALVASLAAILLVSVCLLPPQGTGQASKMVAHVPSNSDLQTAPTIVGENNVDTFWTRLDPFEIAQFTADWSSISSFSACFDWIHQSWQTTAEPEYGEIRDYQKELLYADTFLAAWRR